MASRPIAEVVESPPLPLRQWLGLFVILRQSKQNADVNLSSGKLFKWVCVGGLDPKGLISWGGGKIKGGYTVTSSYNSANHRQFKIEINYILRNALQ